MSAPLDVAEARAKAVADIAEQLAAKDVTPDVIAGYEMIQAAVTALRVAADVAEARNFVEIQMVGLALPFDRAAVVLIRPGGKTPRELLTVAECAKGGVDVQLRFAQSDLEDRERGNEQLREKNAALTAARDIAIAELAAVQAEREAYRAMVSDLLADTAHSGTLSGAARDRARALLNSLRSPAGQGDLKDE
jgi:signal transduction histidine kinase